MRTFETKNELPAGYSKGLLTLREERIAELIAQGAHDREIAELFGLSVFTVKNYLQLLYEKVGVWSRVELALWFEKQRAEHLGLF